VEPPAGAVEVQQWEEHGGRIERYFRGTKRARAVPVDIAGFQSADGTVTEVKILIGEERVSVLLFARGRA
jgi:hypothetical protein